MISFSFAAQAQLTLADVQLIIQQAAQRAVALGANSTTSATNNAVIAVTTREGEVLGVWSVNGLQPIQAVLAEAVSKAGTASFLSSNQNAFTTRTAAYITGQNFPPGITNRPQGALVGIGSSSLSQSDENHFRMPPFPVDYSIGNPVLDSSLTISPGGLPLYKNGILVGGVGVGGILPEEGGYVSGYFESEDIALAGQSGYAPSSGILATGVFLDGIRLPYVESTSGGGSGTGTPGVDVTGYPVQGAPAPTPWPQVTLGGVAGEYRRRDFADPDPVNPAPIADPAGTTPNVPAADRLTQAEVIQILTQGAQRAVITRSAIRQPLSSPSALYVVVMNNPDTTPDNGTNPNDTPRTLGIFRMNDSINDAFDVTPQKTRSALFFSNLSFAFGSRSIGFLAQAFFPPGINGTNPGPFQTYQAAYSAPASTTPPNTYLRDGLTLFGGGIPLYRFDSNLGRYVLIGAVGASGDGVDQDDLVAAAASVGFEAPTDIRADQFSYNNARLPFVKFPRQPVR
ncbi:MAG TPA: heme-binding protein [Candidatus Methylacidiphilales bacterium]|nr:heme-binding protein [Candidatus Methylacidiphilales bacterium]